MVPSDNNDGKIGKIGSGLRDGKRKSSTLKFIMVSLSLTIFGYRDGVDNNIFTKLLFIDT